MAQEQAYPLAWPAGWKRTPSVCRIPARFRSKGRNTLTTAEAMDRLEKELQRLEARNPILSSNITLTLRGAPRSGENPIDPGVAIYFTLDDKRTVLACDKWYTAAENIAALAAHIDCLRGIERYGVGTMEQAFRGYLALEDFSSGTIPWRRPLGFKDDESVTLAQVETKYKELMKLHHTDLAGGDHTQAAQINLAIAEARKELKI